MAVITLPPFYVNETRFQPSFGFGISDDEYGFQANTEDIFNFNQGPNIFQPTLPSISVPPLFSDNPVTLAPFVVSDYYITSPSFNFTQPTLESVTFEPPVFTPPPLASPDLSGVISTGPVTLPPFVVSDYYITSPSIQFSQPTFESVTLTTPSLTFTTPEIIYTGTPLPTTAAPTTTPPLTTMATTVAPTASPPMIFGGGLPTDPQVRTSSPQRDFEAELGNTLAGLQKYQPQLLGMYKDLYQSFMPKGLTAAEASGLAQMQADEAKLNRLRQGILSPEDIRTATQGAREAYGARGQVFAPGAIGAEILNREAIRQQREDQARAAYQQSMGNVLNVSNLQTGNIFQPIGNLLSSTFNPLGAYPADVYGTNVNAALARDIADRNKEAAIESARMAGAAGSSAAKTSAAGSIGAAALPFLAKGAGALFGFPMPSCMPGTQCIDTPNGPKPVKDLKGGDVVIGYNGEEAFIMQACSWNQDPTRTFLTITREDGSAFTVCDDHKILGIPAIEWTEGAEMAGSRIKSITASTGLLTSYDILTNQGGYRIAGVPVNSMIPEIIRLAARFEALSAVQNPA